MFRNYIANVKSLKKLENEKVLLDAGYHNISMQHGYQVMNTNMRNRQQLLLSHMPIMSRAFQERMTCHLNEHNLTLN